MHHQPGRLGPHRRGCHLENRAGRLRHVTAESEPELFWGLRGGKSSLGIITATEFELLELPYIYAGALFFDTAQVDAVTMAWSQWCPTLPAEATTSLALMQLPPMPGVPEPLAGADAFSGGATDGCCPDGALLHDRPGAF